MSTIVVVRKNGVACIGADTMSSLGSLRQRAHHVANCGKIAEIDGTYIGLTGTSASLVVLRSYFSNPERPRDFSSTDAIFETLRYAHQELKAAYHMATQPASGEEYETTQFYGLAANEHGIFAIYSYRTCQEFHQYWAAGSGRDFALGALKACYDEVETAEEAVKIALKAAAEFDSGTGAPFECHSVPLLEKATKRGASRSSGSKKKAQRQSPRKKRSAGSSSSGS
ncbi:MAG: hypothetical protein KDK99_06585 [Verrucomicrobiales bacterium]|nr:hypothetical protein [Verrucomicrobiales bacterium]